MPDKADEAAGLPPGNEDNAVRRKICPEKPCFPLPTDGKLPAPEYEGDNLLAQCMLRLPEKQRAVMILKFQYGFSTRETARALGLSVSAVEKLISRGREKLREIYESEGGVI